MAGVVSPFGSRSGESLRLLHVQTSGLNVPPTLQGFTSLRKETSQAVHSLSLGIGVFQAKEEGVGVERAGV